MLVTTDVWLLTVMRAVNLIMQQLPFPVCEHMCHKYAYIILAEYVALSKHNYKLC